MSRLNQRIDKLEERANINGEMTFIVISNFGNKDFLICCKRPDGCYVCAHPEEALDDFMNYCVHAGFANNNLLVVEVPVGAEQAGSIGMMTAVDMVKDGRDRMVLPAEKQLSQEEELVAWQEHYCS